MRILITGQPASGLHALARMLRRVHGLCDLNASLPSPPADSPALAHLMEEGGFPEDALLAGHYAAETALLEACESQGVRVLCVTRDPFLLFEALYSGANSSRGMPSVPESARLEGASLDSPAVLAFIEEVFAGQLQLTAGWANSDLALMVRQEDLARNPDELMLQLNEELGRPADVRVKEVADEVMKGHLAGSVRNSLSDTRLPPGTVCALERVIPQVFFDLGYERRPCTPVEVVNSRMTNFSRFLDQYTERQRIFLVGYGKSGTTWLHMLFFHHPNTAVVAERRLFEHPVGNEALLDGLLDDDWYNGWFESSSFGKKSPGEADVRYELSRLMSDYLFYRSLALRQSPKGFERQEPITHFSEKIALNTVQDARVTMDNLRKLYPDAKIVHIVRDPRDVSISAMFHSYRNFRGKNRRNWITDFVDSAMAGKPANMLTERAMSRYFKGHAKSWNDVAGVFHHVGESLYGDDYFMVRYEDLLEAPQEQVSRMFAFTSLAHDDRVVADVVEKASFKKLSKGREEGEVDVSSFYRKGIAGDWKNYLTQDAARKVFREARELMEQLGYGW